MKYLNSHEMEYIYIYAISCMLSYLHCQKLDYHTKHGQTFKKIIWMSISVLKTLLLVLCTGLKTTQLGLFGKPALGKYWTEYMLHYFDPTGRVKYFTLHAGLFYFSQLLFKKYYITGLK